jgi:hypothetical protein
MTQIFGTHYNDTETQLWLHLRALEWANWPVFLSAIFVPPLFYFWPFPAVIIGFLIISFLWVPIRFTFVSPSLASIACIAVQKLKWIVGIGSGTTIIFLQQRYIVGVVALLWPFLSAFMGFGGDLDIIERKMAEKIGFTVVIPPP